ncbi:MAG: zinc-ribbon domain-containing protein [Dehalococcoidia bacterium]
MTTESPGASARYCPWCGASLDPAAAFCASCGARWSAAALRDDIPTTVGLLAAAEEWRAAGVLDDANAARLHAHLEARLGRLQSLASPTTAATARTGAATPPPAVPPGPSWSSRHQADILLYLGAFLLVISAVIFVSYQGETLPPFARVALLALYTLGFIVGGLVVQRSPAVREAGRVLLALGALVSPLNFVLIYVELLEERGVPGDLVWLLGSTYALVFYAALERGGQGRLYGVLARVAAVSTWAALADVLRIPVEWSSAWFMALTAAAAALLALTRRLSRRGALLLGLAAAFIAFVATGAALAGAGHHAQLPVTYLLLTAGLAAAGYGLRQPFALPATATAALATVLAALWAAGVDARWGAYAWLAVAAAAIASRGRWERWSPSLARFGWLYAALIALGTMTPFSDLAPGWHAAVAALGAAAVLAVIAWRDQQLGLFSAPPEDLATPFIERVGFAWAAGAMLLVAVALAQQRLEILPPDTGWAFLALAVLAALSIAALVRRADRWEYVLLGPALLATAAGLQPPDQYPAHDAVLLGVPGAVLAAVALVSRRWASALVAAVLLALAALAAWHHRDWPLWTLATACTAAGAALFLALTPRRRYVVTTDREVFPAVAAQLLSWAGAVAGPLVAAVDLARYAEAHPDAAAVHTPEYRALLALIAALAPLLAFEGRRFHRPPAYVAATAVLVLAGLMAIAIREPENIQAYTLPLGTYLVVLGTVLRRSAAVVPRNLYLHEAVALLGAAVIVLPQAEQSFDPGGAKWGFVLIGESALFLALAFLLGARWLAVVAVLTLSGVALRWLAESGDTIPYWLTLGLVGLALLALGFLLLARQDWWSALRTRTAAWWAHTPGRTAGG